MPPPLPSPASPPRPGSAGDVVTATVSRHPLMFLRQPADERVRGLRRLTRPGRRRESRTVARPLDDPDDVARHRQVHAFEERAVGETHQPGPWRRAFAVTPIVAPMLLGPAGRRPPVQYRLRGDEAGVAFLAGVHRWATAWASRSLLPADTTATRPRNAGPPTGVPSTSAKNHTPLPWRSRFHPWSPRGLHRRLTTRQR